MAHFWQVTCESLRLATVAGSRITKAVKIGVGVVSVVIGVSFQDKLTIGVADYHLIWEPPIGWTMILLVLAFGMAVCIAIAVVTTPRLVFLEELSAGDWEDHFGVWIQNTSSTKSIHRCVVKIHDCDPWPEGVRKASFPLHCSGKYRPNHNGADLPPLAKELFDVIRRNTKSGRWELTGAVQEQEYGIPTRRYVITLVAEGDDTPPTPKRFVVFPDSAGKICFCQEADEPNDSPTA